MKIKTIKARIALTVAVLTALLLLVGGLSIWSTVRMNQSADLAIARTSQAGDLRELITSIIKQYQAQADTVINFHVDGKDFESAKVDFDSFHQKFADVADTAEAKLWVGQMGKLDTEYCALYREKVLPAAKAELAAADPAEKIKISGEITKLDDQSDELISGVEEVARKGINSLTTEAVLAQAEYVRFAHAMRVTIIILSTLAVLLAVVLGYWNATSTSDLIKRVAAELQQGSDQAVASASQVSATSQKLAEGSGEQAASIEESSASLEEMASMTKNNADNAQKANDLAREARTVAERGSHDMQTLSTAMQSIKASSDDIAKIIKTIDEIAFQTNILALNAAVEAARAGEAGMGFAVVADEVRNLAQRSAQAAKETAAKIESAISNTTQGVEISGKVAEVLEEIVVKIRQVDELVTEVSSASREQTTGITQINVAVGQMDKVTQSNAASAEESAAAAEELNAQAISMKQAVGELLKLVSGDAVVAPASFRAAPALSTKTTTTAAPAFKSFNSGHVQSAGIAGRRDEIPLEAGFKDF